MILNVYRPVNLLKLAAELRPVIGGAGLAADDLPGPLRIVADTAIDAETLARAQAVVDAHDPAPTPEQAAADDGRRFAERLPAGRLLAALTLRAWPDATPAERAWAAGVIADAGQKIRDARS